MKKMIIAVLAVLVMMTVLVGCGNKNRFDWGKLEKVTPVIGDIHYDANGNIDYSSDENYVIYEDSNGNTLIMTFSEVESYAKEAGY